MPQYAFSRLRSFIHAFIRSFVHSFIHSFMHSFIHSVSQSVSQSYTISRLRTSSIHSFIQPPADRPTTTRDSQQRQGLIFCRCSPNNRSLITSGHILCRLCGGAHSPGADTRLEAVGVNGLPIAQVAKVLDAPVPHAWSSQCMAHGARGSAWQQNVDPPATGHYTLYNHTHPECGAPRVNNLSFKIKHKLSK
jgi:hypothetical protein